MLTSRTESAAYCGIANHALNNKNPPEFVGGFKPCDHSKGA